MPKARTEYKEIGYYPSPRLQEELKLRGYANAWEMPREAFIELNEALTLGQGRYEFDRISKALTAEGDLTDAMRRYAKDFEYDAPSLVRMYRTVAPDARIAIYRAVPKPAPDIILPGAWIALEQRYAKGHGAAGYDEFGGSKLLSAVVSSRDVAWAGTSADEWFFAPQNLRNPEIHTHEYIVRWAIAHGKRVPALVADQYGL